MNRHPDCEAARGGCLGVANGDELTMAEQRRAIDRICTETGFEELSVRPKYDPLGPIEERRPITQIEGGMTADVQGVFRFHIAMLEKLAKKRAEGRSGWNLDAADGGVSIPALVAMLKAHVDKGDMVDIANFAMMIWNREHPYGE